MGPAMLKLRTCILELISSPPSGRELVGPDSYVCRGCVPVDIMEAARVEMQSHAIHEYGYRGNTLGRAPKAGFFYHEQDQPAQPLNSLLNIRYSSPKHWAGPHRDKQDGVEGHGAKDILAATPIVSVTFAAPGSERTFKVTALDGSFEWSEKLSDGDVFVLGSETNKIAEHSVPKEGAEGQVRDSLIFRSVGLKDISALEAKSSTAD